MKTETSTKRITPPAAKPLLTAGLIEDGSLEGIFYILASNHKVAHNRINKIYDKCNFHSVDINEDEYGGLWKLYVRGFCKDFNELRISVNWLVKRKWFCHDSDILINGKEIYSGGKWCQQTCR